MRDETKPGLALQVFDRETGKTVEEGVFAGGFLFWSYNSWLGLALTDLVLKRRFVTELFGLYFRSRRSRKSIESLVRTGAVRLDELTRSLDEFQSFNEFFTRTIDLSRRPIDPRPELFVAPADGRALAYPSVSPVQTWRIKRATFQLPSLIGDAGLTERYSGGAMVILRLHMADYHHFHFPDSGVPEAAVPIPGSYYSVSPYPQRRLIPFYGQNRRMRTLFHSDHFGDVLLIEVGGFAVGSIQQRYEPGRRVERGVEKGYFQFGGSTIVVLFEPGVMELDADLLARTEQDVETLVRLGTSLGRWRR